MDTLQTYDELPYDSLPLPETQPDFLAALAHLHGFEAPDPSRARVLELGCASGGNLIPLASRYPESDCVGIELSRVQAEEGARFISQMGLANVQGSPVLADYDWPSLVKKDGDELFDHYRHTL